MFKLTTTKQNRTTATTKTSPHCCSFVRDPSVTCGFPWQRANIVGGASLSWRLREMCKTSRYVSSSVTAAELSMGRRCPRHVCRHCLHRKLTCIYIFNTETEMSSLLRNLRHCLHYNVSKWHIQVQPVAKISSKWRHYRFNEACCSHMDNTGNLLKYRWNLVRSVTPYAVTNHNKSKFLFRNANSIEISCSCLLIQRL